MIPIYCTFIYIRSILLWLQPLENSNCSFDFHPKEKLWRVWNYLTIDQIANCYIVAVTLASCIFVCMKKNTKIPRNNKQPLMVYFAPKIWNEQRRRNKSNSSREFYSSNLHVTVIIFNARQTDNRRSIFWPFLSSYFSHWIDKDRRQSA